MKFQLFRNALFAIFALAFLAGPAVHAQTPPKGNKIGKPVNVPLNTQKTIKNAQFASNQSSVIEAASCDGDNSSSDSVWFRFTLPYGGLVDIDSGGTMLNSASAAHSFVVLSAYRVDGSTRVEIGCQVSSTARLLNQSLSAGTYLVRIANDSINPPTRASQYRLSVRVRFMSGFLEDPSFENSAFGPYWKVKKAGKPPKITRSCLGGTCVARFAGAKGGKLQQKTAVDPAVLRFKVGDIATANAFINNTGVDGADVNLTLKIVYSDGTSATVVKARRHITQAGTVSVASFGSLAAEVKSKNVRTFIFVITSPLASHHFSVESASLTVQAGTSVRASDLLPVPPAP